MRGAKQVQKSRARLCLGTVNMASEPRGAGRLVASRPCSPLRFRAGAVRGPLC